jgi:hypothetical protein
VRRRREKSDVKSRGSTPELHPILSRSRTGGESGIHGVAVKCVEIVRKASGEGEFLDSY